MIESIILKDFYTTLIDDVAGIKGEKCAFFPQVGEDYQKKLWSLVEPAMVILHHH